MGAADFYDIGRGKSAQAAFDELVSQAQYEHGVGGYSGTIAEKGGDGFVIIRTEPMIEVEARELAYQRIERLSKMGPAECIPIVLATRSVDVKDFNYIHNHDWRPSKTEKIRPELLEAVKPLVKLRKGESIESISITRYSTPPTSYGRHPVKVTYSGCSGTVKINKPATTRIAPICIEIPAGLDWDAKEKEIEKRVQAMRVKAGEKVIAHSVTRDTPGKPKVTAVAPKGATNTKFVVKGSRAHATWETGFETQAQARAWATDVLNDETNQFREDVTTFEIESVTRRDDGQPLVRLVREVDKRIVDVDVTVKLPATGPAAGPDAWLFYGMASE